MPPKVKITKKEILQASLDLLRKEGQAAINARNIAAALQCSTQPVFSNFSTMEELQIELLGEVYDCYYGFLEREAARGEYPQYKAFGMAYIRFAAEEKELFKLMMMRDRGGKPAEPAADFEMSIRMLMSANAITREQAELMHLLLQSADRGIAVVHPNPSRFNCFPL